MVTVKDLIETGRQFSALPPNEGELPESHSHLTGGEGAGEAPNTGPQGTQPASSMAH